VWGGGNHDFDGEPARLSPRSGRKMLTVTGDKAIFQQLLQYINTTDAVTLLSHFRC